MKFLFSVLLISLAACGTRSSDEEQVRALFKNAETAAEERDTRDVLEFVAPDYTDKQGFDKTQLGNFLRGYFLSHQKIELLVNIETLEFPAQGLAQARVAIASVSFDQPGNSDAVTLSIELRKTDGDWRVSRADRMAR
jgi:hypothetical protein